MRLATSIGWIVWTNERKTANNILELNPGGRLFHFQQTFSSETVEGPPGIITSQCPTLVSISQLIVNCSAENFEMVKFAVDFLDSRQSFKVKQNLESTIFLYFHFSSFGGKLQLSS
jgi:hypothetical protein